MVKGSGWMMKREKSIMESWRSAPWPLQFFLVFLLALFSFEVISYLWFDEWWAERPSARWTMESGYLFCVPMVLMAIGYRLKRARVGIIFVLTLQVLYALFYGWLQPTVAPRTVVWAVVSSLFWIGMMSLGSVRRFSTE